MKFKLNNVFPKKGRCFQIVLILAVIVFFVIVAPTSASGATVSFNKDLYAYPSSSGNPKIITVEDTAGQSNVTVNVISNSDPDGTTLQLTERDDSPGIYENVDGLILMNGNNEFPADSTILVRVTDEANLFNISPDSIDTMLYDVESSFPSVIGGLVLTETGPNTAIFEGTFTFSSTGPSNGSTIQVKDGDRFTIITP